MAALRARELGAGVALVERGRLGGTCTNDGCVPTRVWAKAARLLREARQFEDYGLAGVQPAVDFQRLIDRTQSVVYLIHEKKQVSGHLSAMGVGVYENAGDAHFVDEHTVALPDGTQLQADKIIVCTGGHARRLAFPGSEHALTHHDLWSIKELPSSAVILGASATGCQLASILAAFGVHVWLGNRGSHILGTEDELVSEEMARELQNHGIELILNIASIDGLEREPAGGGLTLHLKQGDERRSISTDAVLIALGWESNLETLSLDAAHVKTDRGYILVDDYQRTSVPHIFAAGDITGRMMLVQSAGYEGRLAAENAVLGVGLPYKHQIVPHGGFTDPEYASVGLTEAQARAQGDVAVATVRYSELDRALVDGHTEGFCKLVVSEETHRILGAHIVGEQALEIVELVAAGMAADMWVEQLAELELAYPTYTAIVGLAARRLLAQLGVMPIAPQWLALGQVRPAEWEQGQVP